MIIYKFTCNKPQIVIKRAEYTQRMAHLPIPHQIFPVGSRRYIVGVWKIVWWESVAVPLILYTLTVLISQFKGDGIGFPKAGADL